MTENAPEVEPDSVPTVVPDVTPDKVVEVAPKPHEAEHHVTKRLDTIESELRSLSDKVTALVTPAVEGDDEDDEDDETPVKVPWTHRGFGHKD